MIAYVRESLEFLLTLIVSSVVVMVVLLGPIIIGLEGYAEWKCQKMEEMTGVNTEYVWFDTCYVSTEHGMIPRDRYMTIKEIH